MADKKFMVKTEEVIKSANIIKEKAAKFEAEYKKLYSETATLTVEWKGQSSSAFNTSLNEYRTKLDEMSKLLETFNAAILQATKKYNDTDANLASKVNSLGINR
jgi:WXG100 family type VII secretion target